MRGLAGHFLEHSAVAWQTKHGLGFCLAAALQRSRKPLGCGFTPPPPPSPLVAWQLAQSRSEWQATHWLRLRWASHAW